MLHMFEWNIWTLVGFTGQLFFTARFLVQWIASEFRKKSFIPLIFWYFSIMGGSILLIYAIYRRDIVIISGQAAGLVVYTRNLVLIARERKRKA